MADVTILAELQRPGRIDQLIRIAGGYRWTSIEAAPRITETHHDGGCRVVLLHPAAAANGVRRA